VSYYVHRNGQTLGPYSSDDVVTMLRGHQLALEDLATEEGIEDWHPLGNIVAPELLAPTPQPLPLPLKKKAKRKGNSALAWAAVIAIGIFVAWAASSTSDVTGREERMPWNAGKAFVLKQLTAPSTAKFPSAYAKDVGWEAAGPERWCVWGYVDAQNGFGSMIRTNWRAVVEHRGGDWHRLYLRFGADEVGDRNLWVDK
jgi:hypothetical protein